MRVALCMIMGQKTSFRWVWVYSCYSIQPLSVADIWLN